MNESSRYDLVSLAEIDPTLRIDLRLSTPDNPFKMQFYQRNVAYLRRGTAMKVKAAQADFQKRGLGMKIWSAYRPFVVQVEMFRAVGENGDWVSDPFRPVGKKTHVRAVAIDCTLIDAEGQELAMPTPYLDFEKGAEKMKHSFEVLPEEVLENRALLKKVLTDHGMEPYSGEWWHYQDKEWGLYPILSVQDDPALHESFLTAEIWKRSGSIKQPD
jgi:D-alanyl-D-alanine dipeptidase